MSIAQDIRDAAPEWPWEEGCFDPITDNIIDAFLSDDESGGGWQIGSLCQWRTFLLLVAEALDGGQG
jgi:hypothetical protein